MIIPIRCMSCGKVLADKWNYYEKECKKLDEKCEEDKSLEGKNMDTKTRGKILDHLGLERICCRRHFLGCVDLMELI